MPDSISAFFAMGGYGAFVWSAYAVTFVVLFANFLLSRLTHKRLVKRLQHERRVSAAIASQAAGDGARSQNEVLS